MARKPDVFQQMVTTLRLNHVASPWVTQIPMDAWPSLEFHVVKLLRRYHNSVRRMAAVYAKTYPVAEEMLENLDRMKKGTR